MTLNNLYGRVRHPVRTPSPEATDQETWSSSDDLPDDGLEPIAVVGLSIKFPQEADSVDGFWDMLSKARNSMTEFPPDRLNVDAFYHPDSNRYESFPVRGAHFMHEDVKRFDAPFFGISAAEAAAMDPQQRGLLETSYRALENAGIPIESISGTDTSVYIGSFTDDYKGVVTSDLEVRARYAATGLASSLQANRISWFFNLKGPSIQLDAACSSSLIAFHQGCMSLLHGESETALVGGSNLIFNPEFLSTLSKLNFLSPDSKCWSFDHRANGYGRGEGFSVIVLKRLHDALRDGDTIRAVVRASGSNQDGRTPGITQPNGEAQAKLIADTYAKAKVDRDHTRYFEAHGTGTALGDPIEANAIGRVFKDSRSKDDPLYVGAVKSNVGHLEGASGLAGLVKAILVLERGIIPPNANFEKVNPRINVDALNIKFPTKCIPWPSEGVRRVSVNCFGFGGANAHVILDDACHYLQDHHLIGHHTTAAEPPLASELEAGPLSLPPASPSCPRITFGLALQARPGNRLLLWSAADEDGIKRIAKSYSQHMSTRVAPADERIYLDNLCYTLSKRRSNLPWKAFALADTVEPLKDLETFLSKPIRSAASLNLGFVFTGQGAQWFGMGRELLSYPTYRSSVRAADTYLQTLGCPWSAQEELCRDKTASRVNRPDFSQPLCTIIQVAIVDLLRHFGIHPTVVVGHSSGEIAGAYATGAISAQSAWRLSYYRGSLAAGLADDSTGPKGAMISCGLSEVEANRTLEKVRARFGCLGISVACINSPSNVTVSGDEDHVDYLKEILDEQQVFARKLQVNVAYHSPHMTAIATEYLRLCWNLEAGEEPAKIPVMISSVTGLRISADDLRHSDYWVRNMVSPVRFLDAVTLACSKESTKTRKIGMKRVPTLSVDHLVEVGPHSALQGPVKDILRKSSSGSSINYSSVLVRNTSACDSMMNMVGRIHCFGYPVDIHQVNTPQPDHVVASPMSLTDLPDYPFNHSQQYWFESRLSKGHRFRQFPRHDFLGKQAPDWNPLQARWRNIISSIENPWIEDHKVNGTLLYPAAGMIVMAVEAARLMADASKEISGYWIQNLSVQRGLTTTMDPEGTDTNFYFTPNQDSSDKSSAISDFRLCVYENEQWSDICRGTIKVEYKATKSGIDNGKEAKETSLRLQGTYNDGARNCSTSIASEDLYQSLKSSGYEYGPTFQMVRTLAVGGEQEAVADISTRQWSSKGNEQHVSKHVIHPATLDGVMQMALLALNRGGLDQISTLVPTRVNKMWLAASGLDATTAESVRAWGQTKWVGRREALSSVVLLDAESKDPLLSVEGLEVTAVADEAMNASNVSTDQQTCYSLDWKPDIDMLSSDIALDGPERAEARTKQWESPRSKEEFSRCLDLMAHKNPAMKILEVGAGTGTLSSSALATLTTHGEGENGAPRFDRYDYTDGSDIGFAQAQDNLKRYGKRVSFHTLNIDVDPVQQEFQAAAYDLVIASTLSLSAKNLAVALANIHKLLKTGGRLLIVNAMNAEILKHELVSGSLANRLSGASNYEFNQLSLSQNDWAAIITQNGYTKQYISMPESNTSPLLDEGIILATAKRAQYELPKELCKILVVLDKGSASQLEAAYLVDRHLMSIKTTYRSVTPEEASAMTDLPDWFCIFLLELDKPVLRNLEQSVFSQLKHLLLTSRNSLWLTGGETSQDGNPDQHIITGLARTLRTENSSSKFVTLALESRDTLQPLQLSHISKVIQTTLDAPIDTYETEYVERGSALHIGRIVQAQYLDEHMAQGKQSRRTVTLPFGEGPALELTIESPGLLETIKFKQDPTADAPLAEDEIMVEVEATGVNFRDCLVALGRLTSKTIGVECAGVVRHVGSNCNTLKIGDRVGVCSHNTYKSLVRTKELCAVKLPNNIDTTKAAGMLVSNTTAFYALKKIARAEAGETILVHGGAGGTGQAAIQLAQVLGLEIFTTVSSQDKKRLVMDTYGIPEDHILYSRDLSFAQGIKRMTNGKGVDIVLNSLSGEQLRATWECVAPFGRFIDIGNKDILSNSNLPMQQFAKNVSYTGVDLAYISSDAPALANELMRGVMALVAEDKLYPAAPMTVYGPSQIEDAFRFLQGGNNMGKVVVELRRSEPVQTIIEANPTNTWSFDPNATYVIAGGLGGLGRSMSRWMATRGARNLLLLSRSGPNTPAAQTLLSDLRAQGVTVAAPPCDISQASQLTSALSSISETMPPIRGCIQATMVLRDTMLSNMSFSDWTTSTLPKVQGSWNLHTHLSTPLSFFILLSSVSGIIGNSGQANYAAGNTYMDALAAYRVSQNLPATSICLGAMSGGGALADPGAAELLRKMRATGSFRELDQGDLYALLDWHCDPERGVAEGLRAQVVTGLAAPVEIRAKGRDEPGWMRRPMFRALWGVGGGIGAGTEKVDYGARFQAAGSAGEAADVVCGALVGRLARALTMPEEDIVRSRPMHTYGVDSLVAVEVRNWFLKEFRASVPVFDILGSRSLSGVCESVVERSEFNREGRFG